MSTRPRQQVLNHVVNENSCIYCQERADKLTDEHVIPVGLGGVKTLPKASCESCRKITHSFETTALRHVLGPGRYFLGIKARRKGRRPSTWPAYKLNDDGSRNRVEIPLDKLPFFLCLPTYATNPAISKSIPEEHQICQETGFVLVTEAPKRLEARLAEYGASQLEMKMDHLAYARMLAKIAVGYCVSEFGFGSFTPIVNPLILGETNGFPNLVSSSTRPGSMEGEDVPLEQRYEHNLMHKVASDSKMICVRLDLFSNLKAPSYYVMAGFHNPGAKKHYLLSID